MLRRWRCSQYVIICPHPQFPHSDQLYYELTFKHGQIDAAILLCAHISNLQNLTNCTMGLTPKEGSLQFCGAWRTISKPSLDLLIAWLIGELQGSSKDLMCHTLVCVLHKPHDFCQDPHHTHYPQVELLLVHACIALHCNKRKCLHPLMLMGFDSTMLKTWIYNKPTSMQTE
jgi:hypothetical protein